jgi:xanthine dehydrogenase molybdopterin-binding subunit B
LLLLLRKEKDVNWNRNKRTGWNYDYYTYGVCCTEVEIDVLTGENQVGLETLSI